MYELFNNVYCFVSASKKFILDLFENSLISVNPRNMYELFSNVLFRISFQKVRFAVWIYSKVDIHIMKPTIRCMWWTIA